MFFKGFFPTQVLDLRDNSGIKWDASGAVLDALFSPRLRLAAVGSSYNECWYTEGTHLVQHPLHLAGLFYQRTDHAAAQPRTATSQCPALSAHACAGRAWRKVCERWAADLQTPIFFFLQLQAPALLGHGPLLPR